MEMNNFDYHHASKLEVLTHIRSEIKSISEDKKCSKFITFDSYERYQDALFPTERDVDPMPCGTYRCLVGWMAYRSGINITVPGAEGRYTINPEFSAIFYPRVYGIEGYPTKSVFHKHLDYREWHLLFGDRGYAGDWEERLATADKLIQEHKK